MVALKVAMLGLFPIVRSCFDEPNYIFNLFANSSLFYTHTHAHLYTSSL